MLAGAAHYHGSVIRLELFVDPVCPWTWLTQRWLASLEEPLGLDLRLQCVSLLELNREDPANPWLEPMRQGRRAQRVWCALAERGGEALALSLYRAFGEATFEVGRQWDAEVLEATLEARGLGELAQAADDPRWDAVVLAQHRRALELGGPDVGSPILARVGGTHGIYGPIIDRPLEAQDARRLWDAVAFVLDEPWFFELKRGRTVEPRFGAA